MNKEQELREQYKDRGELTVNFISFAYEHYGDLLDFSDTYVVDQNTEETVLDIKDYCRVKVVPRVFMLQPGTFSYNIIERAINFVTQLREKRKDVAVIPKKTVYKNYSTATTFYCNKHKKEFRGRPDNLLDGKLICKDCVIESKKRTRRLTSLTYYQERLDSIYGIGNLTVLIEESLKDIDSHITVLRCNSCGNIFNVTYSNMANIIAGSHKGYPCTLCEEKKKNEARLKYFIDKFDKLNREEKRYLDFDFSKACLKSVRVGKNLVAKIFNIKCNRCGEYFDMLAGNLLYAVSCPHCRKSSGELVIEGWLKENNILFNTQVKLLNDEVISQGHLRGLLIDFVIETESGTYWIEYHGEQHYVFCTHFKEDLNDFYVQLKRDDYVCDYCKRNNIKFLELPWTLKSTEIVEILKDVLINNTPHPYSFPKIRLNRKKEFPDTGLYRGEFLKQNGLL